MPSLLKSKHFVTLPKDSNASRLITGQALPSPRAVRRSARTTRLQCRAEEAKEAPPQKGVGPQFRRNNSTTAVHGGERAGRPRVSDTITTPCVMSSTYHFENTQQLIDFQEGNYGSFEYGRYGNPTTRAAEEKISALEGAEDCLMSASGMNSATTMLLALVEPGGHIITTTDCYRRTRQFIQTVLPKMGITATVLDPADYDGLEKALKEHQCSLYFSESPTNPYLRCVDISRIKKLCEPTNTIVCIDGTFATPCNLRALDLGADIVLHSATKYLAGHNDVLAGAIAGKADIVQKIRKVHFVLGGVLDPQAAWLVIRGLKTLALRVKQHNDNGLRLAQRLSEHPKILAVHYPGLPSHPEHELAKKQMEGYGGVLSFEIDGDLEKTSKFIDACMLPYMAPSLGGVETLIEQPTIISYWDQAPEVRAKIGIKDNLVRFSCGIEQYEDIESDVLQALDKI